MRLITSLILISNLLYYSFVVFAEEYVELNAFPQAQKGMERFVIMLPHKERKEENEFKVELIAGKLIETDSVNIMRLGSSLESHTIEGWGYIYYKVVGSDVPMSTLMAAPEDELKNERFVSGTPKLIRYNSRLPIVVYAPIGYEVRYRIWNAPKKTETADKR